jgi:hypothetical protein
MEWSEYEIKFLIDNYQNGVEFCSNELKRSRLGIIKKLKKLGFKFDFIKFKYRKENLERIVISSNNIGDILDKMDLRRAGGNYGVIKKYIELYNLDTSHFMNTYSISNMVENFVKKSLDTYLVENSTAARGNIKRRLLEEGILERECSLCGQDENWNGMKISLILDHINGIYNDNRLENLRMVCPNCNAGLVTHCGKNKKFPPKLKKDRNKPRLESRKVERPDYETLKEEVLNNGYSSTGRKYGVSDNSIRKWLKNYEK